MLTFQGNYYIILNTLITLLLYFISVSIVRFNIIKTIVSLIVVKILMIKILLLNKYILVFNYLIK